jgi:hypothetical protein
MKFKWSNGTSAERTLLIEEIKIALLKLEHSKKKSMEEARMQSLGYMDWNVKKKS